MKKLSKGIKKWFVYNGRNLGVVVVTLSTLGYGVYYAVTNKEEIVVEDFGDATISVVAQEISNLSYEDALQLISDGEEDKGLAVMHRLAPLSHAIAAVSGNGDAHFWMALDQLHVEEFGFLNEFPMNCLNGAKLEAPVTFQNNELTTRGQQHLEAAVQLSPGLRKAPQMLAELLVSKGKRNDAVALLIQSAAVNNGQFLELGVAVANARAHTGDEIALREACLLKLVVLGESVQSAARGDISMRLEYLLNVMVLGQFDLARVGVAKFERDFDDRKNSLEMIATLKATLAYFESISALKANDPKAATEYLVKAQQLQKGRDVFVSALDAMVKRFPEVRGILQAGVSAEHAGAFVVNKVDAAKLSLLQAEIFPDDAVKYLQQSVVLAASEPAVAQAYIARKLADGDVNYGELSAMAASALQTKGLKTQARYELLLTQGQLLVRQERWRDAVIALEKALAIRDSRREVEVKLHQLLGQSYKALGQDLIADEHLALAE